MNIIEIVVRFFTWTVIDGRRPYASIHPTLVKRLRALALLVQLDRHHCLQVC